MEFSNRLPDNYPTSFGAAEFGTGRIIPSAACPHIGGSREAAGAETLFRSWKLLANLTPGGTDGDNPAEQLVEVVSIVRRDRIVELAAHAAIDAR